MSILFWRLLFADADLASSATVLDRWHRSFPNLSTPHIKHVPRPRRERAMLRRNECQRLKRAGLLPPADRRAHRLFGDLKQCQCACPTVFQALSPNGYATATREPNHASTSGCPRCQGSGRCLAGGKAGPVTNCCVVHVGRRDAKPLRGARVVFQARGRTGACRRPSNLGHSMVWK